MKKPEKEKRDIEKCRDEIIAVLREYNCSLIDADEGINVLLYDEDTQETISVRRHA